LQKFFAAFSFHFMEGIYLARSANLPEELYVLLALISLFFN